MKNGCLNIFVKFNIVFHIPYDIAGKQKTKHATRRLNLRNLVHIRKPPYVATNCTSYALYWDYWI